MSHRNAQGLAMSVGSAEAAQAFDALTEAFLKYRLDAPLKLKAALTLDPAAPMPHVMKGSFALLAYKAAALPAAQAAAQHAAGLACNPREAMHVAALQAWASQDMEQALAVWEAILAEYPHDLIAFRLHHFSAFWMGRAPAMRDMAERAFRQWQPGMPGYGSMLACRAFAAEECGDYATAEYAGRAAVGLDPADLWAIHAVAHTLEMQGRRQEGVDWVEGLRPHFTGTNNIRHHVLWHQAMYHLELGDHASVLRLYDEGFRDLGSEVTLMQPDLYIDCQNAASMLFRLGRQGVDVGERWVELADKAEARIGDTLSAFTLPHWMMALAATGRFAAGQRLLESVQAAAAGNNTQSRILREAALPVCAAILRHAQGAPGEAVALMRPALRSMPQLGGSHAQQDVLEQFFLTAARDADDIAAQRLLLERVAGRHPLPPQRRVGYAAAAHSIGH